MYAAPFEYLRAGSWNEAVDLLSEHGDEARIIAGGQSLVPMMMLRLAEPAVLVDVRDVPRGAIERVKGHLVVPALVRHVDLEESSIVRSTLPIVAEAAGCIGNVRVRHRGTIGGSLAHAEPSAELPCVAVALGARVRALGQQGTRTIAASELFVGYFENSLASGEVITDIELPVLSAGSGAAFVELTRRAGDFATVAVAAVVALDEEGRCSDVRVVVSAIADRPVDISPNLTGLHGVRPDASALAEAAHTAAAAVDIGLTAHGSREYQREMIAVFVGRALRRAVARAGESRKEITT